MAGRFTVGETMVRPGTYYNEESDGSIELSGAVNGIAAAAFKANFGPIGEIVTLTSLSEIARVYGDDSGENSNVAMLEKIFIGGASQIKAIRVGSGGTNASINLKDTTDEAAVEVVTLTAKYPGTRALSVTIKDSLAVTTQRECIIHSGTKELMKVTFAKGSGEVDALVAAINGSEESILTATKIAAGNGTLAEASQTAFTTPGVSPVITNTDYSAAFDLLEADTFNTLCVDSNDAAVHALVKAFITRANDSGLMAMAVIGEPVTIPYATRKANAAAFNSRNIIYCLNGQKVNGETWDGFNIAAAVAGLVAATPSNQAITHMSVANATELAGALTNTQIVECLQSGALVFTKSASGIVWVEQGINTLVVLPADQDAGWKKIRRTKTRFELIDRINRNTEGITGKVTNDSNGQNTFIMIANGVINEMIGEGKLLSGTVELDPARPPKGDSAWFRIVVYDLDSLEKAYFTYRFSYSADSATAGTGGTQG